MKTKQPVENGSVMAELRAIRDKISAELKGMTPAQVLEFLKKKKTLHPKSFWENKS